MIVLFQMDIIQKKMIIEKQDLLFQILRMMDIDMDILIIMERKF